jgi:excinuclease ABC subunit B
MKSQNMEKDTDEFIISSKYQPSGDQKKAIEQISRSLKKKNKEQTILGVTGSGKTYMMANIVQKLQKPTLVIAHNKTLAAQLAEEFGRFFPNNAVHYFVSYYDYYQPESYIPKSDTYIEKQTQINEEIERLRNASTQSLLTRKDVLIVASVSCIYGLGDPEDYSALRIEMEVGHNYKIDKLVRRLVDLQFSRTNMDLARSYFRLRGDTLEVAPSDEDCGYRFIFFGDELEDIEKFDLVTGNITKKLSKYVIFPTTQYITTKEKILNAVSRIEKDLETRYAELVEKNLPLQAERLKQRVSNDIEMLQTVGFVSGIENYSIYFDGREDGEAPATLLDYFPDDAITFIDESHITLPQISAMYNGDKSRKQVLVDFGFRLPSALNNRPLKIKEFYQKVNQLVYVSATPGNFELGKTDFITKRKDVQPVKLREDDEKQKVVVSEVIIRPTGLLDPVIQVKPTKNQVDDVLEEVRKRVKQGQRVLITTLTKKFAEELDIYFKQINVKSAYIHSDVDTLDRVDILADLRRGKYDVLVGINLLREGLDLPEVSLVAIFDADKEGFLRSKTSLIQIIGRAARHVEGKVIMYADNITDSMKYSIEETKRRREIQKKYNLENNITPQSTKREMRTISDEVKEKVEKDQSYGKAGAKLEMDGFKDLGGEIEFNLESWFSKKSKKPGKGKKSSTLNTQGKQVYDYFEEEKSSLYNEIKEQNLTIGELKKQLQISIDALDFEKAAAIRDILQEKADEI